MTTLKSYMDRIKSLYTEANKRYVERLNALRSVDEQLLKVDSDRFLTVEGKRQKREQLRQAKAEIMGQLDSINSETKKAADNIRNEVVKAFDGLYTAKADAIDPNTLELLKSGILTDAELYKLAEQNKTNNTMRRIIGKYAREREGIEMRHLANKCERASDRPHLDAIDTLCNSLNYIIGDAPLSGIYGAASIGKRIDEITRESYMNAPEIAWSVDGNGKTIYNVNDGEV